MFTWLRRLFCLHQWYRTYDAPSEIPWMYAWRCAKCQKRELHGYGWVPLNFEE